MHPLAPAHVQRTFDALAAANLHCIAQIHESDRAIDLAIALGPKHFAVIRCVEQAIPGDRTALAAMRAEGDFVWAGLVCFERAIGDCPGHVEAFHVSELPRLIERLRELQRVEAS